LIGPIDINNATVTSILCRDDVNDWRRTVYSSGFATLSTWGGPTEDTWYRIEIFRRSSDGYVKYYKNRANGEGWYAPRSYNNARKVWIRGRLDSITDAYLDVFYIRKYSSPEPYASSIGVEQS